MLRYTSLFMSVLLMASLSPGQTSPRTPDQPTTTTSHVPAGKSVTDSKGRIVENGGANANGSLTIKYTGKLNRNEVGAWTVTGEITTVENPASQGSDGPITINTNGEPTQINLEKNGTDPGGHIVTNVTGGNANVSVGGNFNNLGVGGVVNTVAMGGNHNNGSGSGAGSAGTVRLGGRDNGWNSNGGNWSVRN